MERIAALAASDEIPRPEHPRPLLERARWQSLNGGWRFCADPPGELSDRRAGIEGASTIIVPFAPESRLSGIAHTGFMESVWYERQLEAPPLSGDERLLLHFGAVDWHARIFIDGEEIGEHFGGTTRFAFDITESIRSGATHRLTVHAVDRTRSFEQPLGKQSRQEQSYGCYYTRTTGIWQPVWLEVVGATYLDDLAITPDLEGGRLFLSPRFARPRHGLTLMAEAFVDGASVSGAEAPAVSGIPLALQLAGARPWSPEDPHLYDLELRLLDGHGRVVDAARSYAGLRSVEVDGDRLLLNGAPRYLRFVLDQGFYPEGIWTAPSDDHLRRDIEVAKAMGFNGARLHQKVFEPRFHAWADRLGYLTWGESASWGFDVDAAAGARNFLQEWSEVVQQCRNHPSIIAWTPLNESGHRIGRQPEPVSLHHRRLVAEAAALTRRLDPSRPVNDASGWVHRDTDLWTSHSYEQDPAKLQALLAPHPDVFRNAPVNEPAYAGQPYYLDEFGGAAWSPAGAEAASREALPDRGDNLITAAWGYGEAPKSVAEFEARIRGQVDAVLATPHVRGYCYTQLTDIEQEQNGLLTYDREPKLPLETYRAIFSRDPGR
jgi:beta-galactosidase/beta-glucuronidase